MKIDSGLMGVADLANVPARAKELEATEFEEARGDAAAADARNATESAPVEEITNHDQ